MALRNWLLAGLLWSACTSSSEDDPNSPAVSDSVGDASDAATSDAAASMRDFAASEAGSSASPPMDAAAFPAAPNRASDGGAMAPTDANVAVLDAMVDCATLPSPEAPVVLIVLDRSSSMLGLDAPPGLRVNRWEPAVSALHDFTAKWQQAMAFGLMLFPARASLPVLPELGAVISHGQVCLPGKLDLAPAFENAGAISRLLDDARPDTGATPMNATLTAARGALVDGACAVCSGRPVHVLLLSDGQPTCATGHTMPTAADVTAVNEALTALTSAGVKTHVVGMASAQEHLLPPILDGFAQSGGTQSHYAAETETELRAQLDRIADAIGAPLIRGADGCGSPSP